MNRREILGVAGLGLAGVALGATESRAQHPHHHDPVHGECLKACSECATICNETYHHCFHKVADGHAEHHRTVVLSLDCHAFCCLSADLMERESPLVATACRACAEACQACAEECAKHDDPQMKECAEACKKCAASCREMARTASEHEKETR